MQESPNRLRRFCLLSALFLADYKTDGGKDVGKNNRHIRAYSLIWMDYGTYGGQMREIVLYHSRYFGAWLTLDTFGFSVILNIDYMNLIIRIGALVVLIGR